VTNFRNNMITKEVPSNLVYLTYADMCTRNRLVRLTCCVDAMVDAHSLALCYQRRVHTDLGHPNGSRADLGVIFLFHVLMAMRCVFRSVTPELDEDQNHWELNVGVLFHAMKADIVLTAVWMLPHVFLMAIAFTDAKRCDSLLSCFREPWDKVTAGSMRALEREPTFCEIKPFQK
jgi:hypothetical protein